MPIDLCSSIKKTSQWAFGSSVLNSILGSSVFVSFIIALIMVLLIMIMYPAKAGTPFSVVAKMFVYMLFSSMLVIFLHDGVIKYMFEEEMQEQKEDAIITGGTTGDLVYNASNTFVSPYRNNSNTAQTSNENSGSNTSQPISPHGYRINPNNNESVESPVASPMAAVTEKQEITSIVEGGPVTGGKVFKGIKITNQPINPFKLNQ
jgi:hypothetical protein